VCHLVLEQEENHAIPFEEILEQGGDHAVLFEEIFRQKGIVLKTIKTE